MGYSYEFLDVQDADSWIRNHLAEHSLCVGTKSSLKLFLRGFRVHERAVDAKFLQGYSEQVERASVNLVRRHDVVSGSENVYHGEEISRLARRCQHGSDTALKFSYLFCYGIVCRVLETSIKISFLLEVEEHRHLFAVIVLECCALDDWELDRLAVFRLVPCPYAE